MYEYKAKIVEWKDADTPVVTIDLGFTVTKTEIVRVRWLNTPEITGKEKPLGIAALNFARELAPVGSLVMLKSHKPGGGDKFGRYLADITLNDGRDYATTVISAGHGKQWNGQGQKPTWDVAFGDGEAEGDLG